MKGFARKTVHKVMSALGRKGGRIGGVKRMASMTAEQRRAFAMLGVKARREKKRMKESRIRRRKLRMARARRKGTHTAKQWRTLLAEVAGRCVRCMEIAKLTKDHIVPIYQGGSDAIENLQPVCRKCNNAKGPENINWLLARRQSGWY
jgi:HNH endonuclease